MPFVKLDCGILNSTLWPDREAREIFITALLMAIPTQIKEDIPAIEVDSLDYSGFTVPAGYYGMVNAAGTGIVRRAGIDKADGIEALKRLSDPDDESRSPEFEGRRLARVNGGYIILNYDKYREKDYTAAQRMRDYRQRLKDKSLQRNNVTLPVTLQTVTQGEAEADTEAIKEEKLASLAKKEKAKADKRPSNIMEAKSYGVEIELAPDDVDAWWDHFTTNGWKVGRAPGTPMQNWKSALRNWKRNKLKADKGLSHSGAAQNGRSQPFKPIMTFSGLEKQRNLLGSEIEKIRSMASRQEGGLTASQNSTIQGHVSKRKEIYEAMKTI